MIFSLRYTVPTSGLWMWFCCFCATVLIEKKDIYFPLHRKAPDRSKMTNISFFWCAISWISFYHPHAHVLSLKDVFFCWTKGWKGGFASLHSGVRTPLDDRQSLLPRIFSSWHALTVPFSSSSVGALDVDVSQVWRQTLRESTNFVFGEQLTWRWLSWRVKPRAELLYACTFLYACVCVCVCVWMRILLSFKYIFITCRRLMCWSCEHLQKENNSYSIRTIHASSQICAEGSQTFNNNAEFIILFIFCPIICLIFILIFYSYIFFFATLIVSLNNLFLPSLGAGNIAPHSERKRGDAERKAL